MRTYTAVVQENRQIETTAKTHFLPVMNISLRETLAVLAAITTATGIVLLSVWLVGMGIDHILGAATWGLGFIFLGLTLDNQGRTAYFQLSTGVALLSLACLQNIVSLDFTIAVGVLLAAWVVALMFRQLR